MKDGHRRQTWVDLCVVMRDAAIDKDMHKHQKAFEAIKVLEALWPDECGTKKEAKP